MWLIHEQDKVTEVCYKAAKCVIGCPWMYNSNAMSRLYLLAVKMGHPRNMINWTFPTNRFNFCCALSTIRYLNSFLHSPCNRKLTSIKCFCKIFCDTYFLLALQQIQNSTIHKNNNCLDGTRENYRICSDELEIVQMN